MLKNPYSISQTQKDFYIQNEFIKLKNVLAPEEIAHWNDVVTREVQSAVGPLKPLSERDTYGKAFIQITNLWQKSAAAKELVFGERLAQIATELLDVKGVRLYHDQALFKESGGGYTPWHADQYYWPLKSPKTITAWIPLQETSLEMGALEFSAGSHSITDGRGLAISDSSEDLVGSHLIEKGCKHVIEPFDLGEVSFHSGWLFHRAAPNNTNRTRKVMCIIYMDENMRLSEPQHEDQRLDRETWCPGIEVGEIVDSTLNPVLYSAK